MTDRKKKEISQLSIIILEQMEQISTVKLQLPSRISHYHGILFMASMFDKKYFFVVTNKVSIFYVVHILKSTFVCRPK